LGIEIVEIMVEFVATHKISGYELTKSVSITQTNVSNHFIGV